MIINNLHHNFYTYTLLSLGLCFRGVPPYVYQGIYQLLLINLLKPYRVSNFLFFQRDKICFEGLMACGHFLRPK